MRAPGPRAVLRPEDPPLPKAEWGAKRLCESCGAKFYDMSRRPPTCPSCGAAIGVGAGRGTRTAAEEKKAVKNGAADVDDEVEDDEDDELLSDDEEEGDDLGGVPIAAPAGGEDEEA